MASSPALIFDLDGTLVDTAPDLLLATNAVLAHAGREPVDPQTFRHLVGFGARVLIEKALAATGDSAPGSSIPELFDIFISHYRANIAVGSRPFPRVAETLGTLGQQGARMAVLTNKPQDLADLLLPKVDLDSHFGAVFGAGRRPYSKPDPRIFHETVEAVGGTGRGAVMIGDSITDVLTARAANVPVILVSYGYTPEPASSLGADAVTDDFAEIPALAARILK